jgi:hypothetical protein
MLYRFRLFGNFTLRRSDISAIDLKLVNKTEQIDYTIQILVKIADYHKSFLYIHF